MGRKETRRVERRRGSRRCGLLVLIGYNLVFLSGFTPCHSYSDSFFILFTICNMFGYIEIAAENMHTKQVVIISIRAVNETLLAVYPTRIVPDKTGIYKILFSLSY
jgi:hypothetical protein